MITKIIALDFDGVLADSFVVAYHAFSEISEKLGIPHFEPEEFRSLFDGNFYEELQKRGVAQEKIPPLLYELEDILPDRYVTVQPIPGAKKMMETLTALGRVYIISSNISSVIEEYLRRHGFPNVPVLGAEKETSKKKKLFRLKEQSPEAPFYFIGDTKGEVLEGKAAGVRTLAVTWGYHNKKRLQEAKPEKIFEKPKEVVEYFLSLN
ncbi:MAG: HAD hydrolase-like protein [Nanoarchaeota archaeon]|nr:HAD hydrolase-like protein [Nanoarchaeota archaeon]